MCLARNMGQKLVSAASPETSEGIQYHISAKKGQVGSYVFLPGDPDRVPKIAALWIQRMRSLLIESIGSGLGH